MFRRLRARLDRMEAQGTATLVDIRDLVAVGKDFLDDLADGFAVEMGPMTITVKPQVDVPEKEARST